MSDSNKGNHLSNQLIAPLVTAILAGIFLLYLEHKTDLFATNESVNVTMSPPEISVLDVLNYTPFTNKTLHGNLDGDFSSIYCEQKVRLANSSNYSTSIVDYTINASYKETNLQIDSHGNTQVNVSGPIDTPFYCIRGSIASEISLSFVLPEPTPTPFEGDLPIYPFDFSIEIDPREFCSSEITWSKPYIGVNEVLSNLPLRIEENSVLTVYVLTRYDVDRLSYQYNSAAINEFIPVNQQITFTSVNGQKLSLPTVPCFYVR